MKRVTTKVSQKIAIGLLWHSDNSGNLGVGALTIGNIALVRKAAQRAGVEPEFHLFAAADNGPSYIPDDLASRTLITGRTTLSPDGFWSSCGKIDVMLDICGGDSFTDIYSGKRFSYQAITKILCIMRGVPLVLSPQTIGPFSREPHTSVARWILERASMVVARDPLSMQALEEIAPRTKSLLAVDVAFALPFEALPKGPGIRFGLGISGLLYSGGRKESNEFSLDVDYREFTHKLIDALLNRGGITVELIKHVYAPGTHEDDSAAAHELLDHYPALIEARDFISPSDAKSYISGLDFLIAARMHATIAAYSSGVPVVPISYSRKFEGLFGGLGYDWLVPVKGMSTGGAVAYVLDAFDRRDEVGMAVAAGQNKAVDLLEVYVERLAALLAEVKSKR